MPINSIRDNENNRWNGNAKKRPQQQKNKQSWKRTRRAGEGGEEDTNYSEKMRAKWFCCAFKLDFLQLNFEFRVSFINYFKTKRITSQSMLSVDV